MLPQPDLFPWMDMHSSLSFPFFRGLDVDKTPSPNLTSDTHTHARTHACTGFACQVLFLNFFLSGLCFFHFLFLLSVTTLLLTPFPAFSKTCMWKEATFYRGQWKNWNVFSLRHLCQISHELLNHAGNTLRDCRFRGWFESKPQQVHGAPICRSDGAGCCCLLTSPWVVVVAFSQLPGLERLFKPQSLSHHPVLGS